eukprot:1138653-Pelagomonas_calceolata.AAC.1
MPLHMDHYVFFKEIVFSNFESLTGEQMRGSPSAHQTAPVVCAVTGVTGRHVIAALGFISVFSAHWAPTKLAACVLCQPPGYVTLPPGYVF